MIDKKEVSLLHRVIFNDGYMAGIESAIKTIQQTPEEREGTNGLEIAQKYWDTSKTKQMLDDLLKKEDEHDNMGKQTRQTQLGEKQEFSVRPRTDGLL